MADNTEDTNQNHHPVGDTCLECGATFDACVCEPYGGVNRWWIDDPQHPAALARYPNGQPELADLLQATPEILHDKGCPCYPRRPRILCTCGLYEILLENSAEPIPPNYGQIPYECIDGCGPRCTGSCGAEPPEGSAPNQDGTSYPLPCGLDEDWVESLRLPSTPFQQDCERKAAHAWINILHTTQQCSVCGKLRADPKILAWTAADDLEAEYMAWLEEDAPDSWVYPFPTF